MTSPLPLVNSTNANAGASSSAGSTASTPSNTLGPDSFITLLTAQLQAQDPLSPMDPDQMVNELTSINTLQQIVQIRTDMDTLVGALPQGQGNSGSVSTNTLSNLSSANSAFSTAPKLYSKLGSLNALNSSSQSF